MLEQSKPLPAHNLGYAIVVAGFHACPQILHNA